MPAPTDLVNAISGKDGDAYFGGAQYEITQWSIEPSVGAPKYASNLTQNHKVAVDAVGDFTGTMTIVCTGSAPPALRSKGVIVLYGAVSVTAYVVITQTPVTVDINDGEPTFCQVTFEPRGPITILGQSSSG